MNVLYVASEARPFAASGGLADVAGSLPKALKKKEVDCRVIMPMYGIIPNEFRNSMRKIADFTVPVGWRHQYCGLFEINLGGVIFYFLDNEYYFKHDALYGHFNDAERFSFFSRAVLCALFHIDFHPQIIHCNDWQSALVPVYYHLFYKYEEGLENIKFIFTIHNIQYQGKYGFELLNDVCGIPDYATNLMEFDKCVNFMKSAIVTSDFVSTVSPSYANEILEPWFSHGLDPLLRDNAYKLTGILNGIDYDLYNPETDQDIYANFSANNLEGKLANKRGLLHELNLSDDIKAPVVGIVSRLVSHKGIDLIKTAAEQIVHLSYKIAILGSGDSEYEAFFSNLSRKYPDRVSTRIGFNPNLAKKIYAGSDMLLMPSQSEPCGLAQMIALRYGTVPIIRETGGLRDSIQDCTLGKGNGFTFPNYNAHEMLDALHRAKELYYNDTEDWKSLVEYCLSCDYSWKRSADEYINLYERVLYD